VKLRRWVEDRPVWYVLLAWLTMAFLLGLLLFLSGCGPVGGDDGPEPTESPTERLDEAGRSACGLFSEWQRAGADDAIRTQVVRRVDAEASDSASGDLANRAGLLLRLADDAPNESWALAADRFVAECQHQGWTIDD
jgi:hypothetical protein